MPIVCAGRLLRRPLRERLAGSDLFPALWARLIEHRVPTVVVAASTEVADRLGAEHTKLRCALPSTFDADDEAAVNGVIDEIVAATDAIGARFVVASGVLGACGGDDDAWSMSTESAASSVPTTDDSELTTAGRLPE